MDESLKSLLNEFEDEDVTSDIDIELVAFFHRQCKNLLFLDYLSKSSSPKDAERLYEALKTILNDLVSRHPEIKDQRQTVRDFLSKLPEIRRLAFDSANAIYDGDPSARSVQEVILAYPGFEAILSYRIAHALKGIGLDFEARLISEEAHSKTGVDINPGCEIGSHFFIDHGTGIVIGETAVIGDYVKIYQGVTLGALSLSQGQCLKGSKRHPTVEDHVTIYSNAAIFGGETIIGHHSTVGAVVRLDKSLPPYSVAYIGENGLTIESKRKG